MIYFVVKNCCLVLRKWRILLQLVDELSKLGEWFLVILLIIWLMCVPAAMANEVVGSYYIALNLGGAKSHDMQYNTEAEAPLVKSKHQVAAVTSLLLGYKFSPNVRFAFDFSYLPKWRTSVHNNTNGEESYYHAELSSLTAGINAYYELADFSVNNIMPYVVFAVGVSRNEVGDVEEFVLSELSSKFYGNSQFNLMWKVGAGIDYKLNDRAAVSLGYNFASLGGVKTKVSSSAVSNSKIEAMELGSDRIIFKNIYSHQFLLGLRIAF